MLATVPVVTVGKTGGTGVAVNVNVIVVEFVTVTVNVPSQPIGVNPVRVIMSFVDKLCAALNTMVAAVPEYVIDVMAGSVGIVTFHAPFQPDGVNPVKIMAAPLNKLALVEKRTVPTDPAIVALVTVASVVPPVMGPVNVVPSQL